MQKTKNLFKDAVQATPEIAANYKNGLSALGIYSAKIIVGNTKFLNGSIDIDSGTLDKYPNENRWDYAISYKNKVYFIEVHSAKTSEVKTVLKKLVWLKNWLNVKAPFINKLKAQKPYYWIQSKQFAIPKSSSQYRIAISAGLKPINKLELL
jgi:hypothetical protein